MLGGGSIGGHISTGTKGGRQSFLVRRALESQSEVVEGLEQQRGEGGVVSQQMWSKQSSAGDRC